jgi:putative ABC transport system permease protein
MIHSLRLSTAAKIAWREMRASSARFAFVVLSIAVGVAALTGVRSFSQSFRHELLLRARSILAADISASLNRQLSPAEAQSVHAAVPPGGRDTWVMQTISMASTPEDPNPLLVSLKVINPAEYPFYGTVKLADGAPLQSALTDQTVVVAQDLLIRLRTQVGGILQLGTTQLRIAGVIISEPDALVDSIALGPRVLITQNAAARAGLLKPGSRGNQRYLFALPAGADVTSFRARLQTLLPDAQVSDYRETNPTITQGVDRATAVLSLVSLVALVLGAIAVAMAMRAHLQQRLDNIATMKTLGATSSHILRIYILQTLFIGAIGGLLGIVLGYGVERLLPLLFRSLIHLQPAASISISSLGIGFLVGLLTTQLFTLPTLLMVRRVRPAYILHRDVQPEGSGYEPWRSWRGLRQRLPQIFAALLLLLGLGAIAGALSDSALIGRWFAIGLATALLVLLGTAWLLLFLIRLFLSRTRWWMPAWLRHGLANLYRPGNQTPAILAALGIGVMLSMTVFFMQKTILSDLRQTTPKDLPNVFLVDIAPSEIDGVRALVNKQPGVSSPFEGIPVVTARLSAIDGKPPVEKLPPDIAQQRDRAAQRTVTLSWAARQPTGLKVEQGAWWPENETGIVVSVGQRAVEHYNLHVGSMLTFTINDRELQAKVVSLHRYNSLRAGSRSEFLFPPAALEGFPVIWFGAVNMQPSDVSNLTRAMFSAYPSVTVVNLADALTLIHTIVENISRTIEFLAAFCIFAAAILLASSVAGTRFRRIREVVILKTLGATRRYITAVLTVEFLLMGSLGAFVGLIFAHLLTFILLSRAVKLHYGVTAIPTVLAIIVTALLACIAGWAACFRILVQKPLAVLRQE